MLFWFGILLSLKLDEGWLVNMYSIKADFFYNGDALLPILPIETGLKH